VSEHEIFKRGLASQLKWSMALESQNSSCRPKLKWWNNDYQASYPTGEDY
jgi:hypothetical protein